MKILVLGKDGMLGRYVYTYLKKNFDDVVGTTRKTLDVMNINEDVIEDLNLKPADVVINCIGLIPQRGENNKLFFVIINSFFPLLMKEMFADRGAKFIHITTDCVFSGITGSYDEFDIHDDMGIYGKSKSIGEPDGATTIRTSIIGEESGRKLSLLEWAKGNKGKDVNGYTNHYWNGITCLQFAKLCEQIIKENLFWAGVKHITSPTAFSKYELLKMISDEFKLDLKVNKFEADHYCNRTLSTCRDDVIFNIPELSIQLEELSKYTLELGAEE